jgi:hypothetical protein
VVCESGETALALHCISLPVTQPRSSYWGGKWLVVDTGCDTGQCCCPTTTDDAATIELTGDDSVGWRLSFEGACGGETEGEVAVELVNTRSGVGRIPADGGVPAFVAVSSRDVRTGSIQMRRLSNPSCTWAMAPTTSSQIWNTLSITLAAVLGALLLLLALVGGLYLCGCAPRGGSQPTSTNASAPRRFAVRGDAIFVQSTPDPRSSV